MNQQTSNLEEVKRAPMVAVMLIGAFVGLLNETLLATALPSIMADFGILETQVQWLTTAFLLTNGIMIPISAFLIERFTTRQLFITALSIFALGTFVASISHSFELLLAARVIQAAGSGIMLPLMMTVMLAIFPVEKRGAAMGMAGIVISFAPAIGPTLSGWLLEFFSWRGLFYVVLPIVIIAIIVAAIYVKNVTKQTFPKIDILSILLSSFGFGGLLYGFSSIGGHGPGEVSSGINGTALTIIIIGAIILTLFIIRQMKMNKPMLEFRVFKYPIYSLSLIITAIVLMALIGAETILPLYMQNTRDFSPLDSGLMLLPGAIVMGIMSPITGMLFDKFGAKWLAASGLTIVTATTFLFTNLSLDTAFSYLVIIYAIRMFGLSLVMMPVMTAGLNQLPVEWHPHGTAMANTMQQVSASIGTAILISLMTTTVANYQPDQTQLEGLTEQEAMAQVAGNAAISGYTTVFWLATILSIVGLVLSFFLKTKKNELANEKAA
ncbi:MFS transporter, DHA2 family, multidrug resistance protein [Gracilibacillus ureilyticus]|uniref:MFS transporter, DHA2 family, multidrug resistance protein n=1 Tax=Gracilibacillus ureilyticus TaxID=531814 RepID=A0A1H9NKL0_9BACI|nr:MDR family MFS transporter [Gracilibacillus ureilyticus]SER36195.1 MFS transporter, DHA2 family, multidrug resistance protein [Gracilibacillus ureilyticus]